MINAGTAGNMYSVCHLQWLKLATSKQACFINEAKNIKMKLYGMSIRKVAETNMNNMQYEMNV